MNSSTQQLANTVIDSLIIAVSSANIFMFMGIFGYVVYHLSKTRNTPNQVALLLTANMYLVMLVFSILLLDQHARALLGHLHSLLSLNDKIYCQIRAYFLLVSVSAIFCSNALQAVYRLCRVIFYTKRSLLSFQLYKLLIILQWMMCFFIKIPALSLGYFKYSPHDHYCQVEYTNFRILPVNAFFDYIIPMSITTGCYVYTLRKLRGENRDVMTQIQQTRARRDVIILSRICLLLGILLIIFIPSIVTFFITFFTNYVPWWSIQIQWLVFSLSVTCIDIVLALVFPHVRNLWRRNPRCHHQTTVMLAVVRAN